MSQRKIPWLRRWRNSQSRNDQKFLFFSCWVLGFSHLPETSETWSRPPQLAQCVTWQGLFLRQDLNLFEAPVQNHNGLQQVTSWIWTPGRLTVAALLSQSMVRDAQQIMNHLKPTADNLWFDGYWTDCAEKQRCSSPLVLCYDLCPGKHKSIPNSGGDLKGGCGTSERRNEVIKKWSPRARYHVD